MSNYVLATHRFTVDWGGANIGFQEVSGLTKEYEVLTYEDGSFPDGRAPMQSPGKTKFSEMITLSRGYFRGDTEMQDWLDDIRTDETQRRNLVITMLDERQQPVMTWTVYKAWPSKIDGLNLNSGSSEIAVEKIEIRFEGFDFQMH